MATLRTRQAAARDPLPVQDDRLTEDLRIGLESEQRRRRLFPHSDGDGLLLTIEATVGISRHPHRLGRKPRHVQIVGLPSSGSGVELVELRRDEVLIGNTGAFTVTFNLMVY